ncbi:MAG: hypothetical protein P4L03_04580 [Terracidiphilus sp.]|nr:hypothetical protein [Terracidiphilus sp.]
MQRFRTNPLLFGVVAALILAAVPLIIFFVARDQRMPSGGVNEAEMPSGITGVQENAEGKTQAATKRHIGEWINGIYMFPVGPCTMIVKAGGSFWFTLPHDETQYYSEDIDSAKEAASTACDEWYSNEMAGRLAVQRANEELEKQHPTPHIADRRKPLFTRDGTLVCPSWEALEYAANARLEGWRRSTGLFGIVDPTATAPVPHVGEPVSAEFYGCTIYKDGVPVQVLENSYRGVGPKTSLGWLPLIQPGVPPALPGRQ